MTAAAIMKDPPPMTLAEWLWEKANGTVQSGPFIGMKLPAEKSWSADDICPRLLGCYEQELHPALEAEIFRLMAKPRPKIVNIGCAEGYYAIGLARRLPHADVLVIDIDDRAIEIAEQAAAMNGVKIISGVPVEEAMENADLIVIDAEGDEVIYLDFDKIPSLKTATIICEIHVRRDPFQQTDMIVGKRFQDTHTIDLVEEGARNPNGYEPLRMLRSEDRWAAINEGRPCTMCWFIMRPKRLAIRTCGGCTMCCTEERIPELAKPKGAMCKACEFGKGCKIYDERPGSCRNFQCEWLVDPGLPEAARPDRIGAYAIRSASPFVKIVAEENGDTNLLPEYYLDRHMPVIISKNLKLEMRGKDLPDRMVLDWTIR